MHILLIYDRPTGHRQLSEHQLRLGLLPVISVYTGPKCRFKLRYYMLAWIMLVLQFGLRPCSHCRRCAGTVPMCRISGVCERAMSAIKLDHISENVIRSREGSVFRHNYLCLNKCNVNADYTCVAERWRCRQIAGCARIT